ncbi:conserved hypothetical protein [Phenylobacterium zucineum HLK1]|uniref:3-keto-alpha-glucoside-1,2-lyase/3-keto-2-hydroxy-glucal hydratase domain-containing protein n=1 Tax=Phenylobacterium zucineum (strain HLK1) TaxID=450851 RepID=B4REP4_PHEZH|nr:DUF1080 domain-containing protein [Phenylobacterium zucineum]ACG78570.1 conserved hypothetical protein [Phenylobacterium zucineum HLK1]
MRAAVLGLAMAIAMVGQAASAADNTLTAAEKAAGWRLLFDGRSLEGWRGFKTPEPDAGWTVTDGMLGPDPKTSRDIMTKETFGDFELAFDWKVGPKGNSGVMFRVTEAGTQTYQSGPEYQIVDNARGEPVVEQAGALYGLYAPTTDATRPVGEFNHSRLVLRGGKGEHWLNGVKVAEYDLDSDAFRAKVAATKFRAWPQFAAAKSGHIAIQNHGDPVFFRNIKIRPLD